MDEGGTTSAWVEEKSMRSALEDSAGRRWGGRREAMAGVGYGPWREVEADAAVPAMLEGDEEAT